MINRDTKMLFEAYKTVLEAQKVGDIVQVPESDLVYDFEENSKFGFFADSFDPQGGAGGWDPFASTIAAKETDKWFDTNKDYKGEKMSQTESQLDYFLPKSPSLSKMRIEAGKFLSDYRDAAIKTYPVVGKVRPTEKYKFIIDEETYRALPENVIAVSEYDYSFHAGEGNVASWIMAIGSNEADVKQKLNAALKKVKSQYVGSEMELKYAQKRAVGR